MKIQGYAATFGNIDDVNDMIVRGAFGGVKSGPLLYNHDQAAIIGKFTGKEDKKGYLIEADLFFDIPKAEETFKLIQHGSLKWLSIGYRDRTIDQPKRNGTRTILKLQLLEVSVVLFPANKRAVINKVLA